MNPLRSRTFGALMSMVTAASVLLAAAPTVLAAAPVLPMAGERFLTSAERQAAVDTMRPHELDEIGNLFAAGAPGLVVAYTRREFNVVQLPDGTSTVEPAGVVSDSPGTSLSIPSMAVAGTGGKPGTDLYISVTVIRTRTTPPYEWQISAYADWKGKASPTGMDAFNNAEDSIGVAWAGNLYIQLDTDGGLYKPCSNGIKSGVDIYKSDVTPNLGIGYSFHEWGKKSPCLPHGQPAMEYARGTIYIRESSWKGLTSNVVMKYFHTFGGLSYALYFSNPPGVAISPTQEQWSAAAYTSFSH